MSDSNNNSLPKHYDASITEGKWYEYWMGKDYFSSIPDEREPYSIVIPPPNVTGVLHMGHMLNNTIQDVLIRKARLDGKNACWVPGTDHASIATEAKVVKLLREKGIKKSDLSRADFLKHAFEWKEKYGGLILQQLRLLGASCDWKRTRFTMEDKLSDAVIHVFMDLYEKGMLYRGLRMTNWDSVAKTVLSNEEVIHQEEHSFLYHLRYKIVGEENHVVIATTRPETILADTAVAVNPNDERYHHLKGKRVIVPFVNREVPVIFDTYVKTDFGTGALKITPAHDMNDYEIGLRHQLDVIEILDESGKITENAGFYVGMDREAARKAIAKDLDAAGFLVEKEAYINKVGRSERTNTVVEPRLTKQWFLKMEKFCATALKAVEDGEISFMPEHMINMYRNWLKPENVRDWCISRQLWWGQQIPAYYFEVSQTIGDQEEKKEDLVVAKDVHEALHKIKEKYRHLSNCSFPTKAAQLRQDEDVVDTWFSSWLWPISVFDGFEDQRELKYYYPTNVLVTGWDIMFFWVARMVMAGYEWAGELLGEHADLKGVQPFKDVYFTGMVRDKLCRKMSKSLGNSPDSIELINKYGADGVRFGILSASAAGNDVIFDAEFTDPKNTMIKNESKLCDTGKKFTNKLWNALRLVKGWPITTDQPNEVTQNIHNFALRWLENKYQQLLTQLNQNFEEYRLSDGVKSIYNFLWNDFCSWYLEMIKPDYQQPVFEKTLELTLDYFEKFMTLLHPFMPFITEEIWMHLKERTDGDDCFSSRWDSPSTFDEKFIHEVDQMKELVANIRDLRNRNQLKAKELLQLSVRRSASSEAFFANMGMKEVIMKIGFIDDIELINEEDKTLTSFMVSTHQFFLRFDKTAHSSEDTEAKKQELLRLRGFLKGIEAKLNNQKFVNNAPAQVVDREKKKMEDTKEKIALLEQALS